MATEEMVGCDQSSSSVQGVRIPSYVIIDAESFDREYWPKLENAINVILQKDPGQPFNLSFEDLYSVAYKCGSQNFSETMFCRLTEMTSSHMSSIFVYNEGLPPLQYLQATDFFLTQFSQAVYGISSVFSYMDRSYVVVRYGRNISSFLHDQLAEAILSNARIFDILQQVSSGHLEIDPQIMMSVIKGLYAINQDFAKMNMVLFSRFIPNVETSCHLENWPSTPEEYCNFHKEIIQNHEHERILNKRKVDEISEDLNECRKRVAKPT